MPPPPHPGHAILLARSAVPDPGQDGRVAGSRGSGHIARDDPGR
ncbi:MAG TPA: hypothetical protein VFA44_03965 [Gaiellaceae bacterium]|nr:hypothetical protein [Gaiellaceae bacterium]